LFLQSPYTHVRRSMLAVTFTSDGHAAADHATHALHQPQTPARIRGLAAKQLAYGYALTGSSDASKHALDQTFALFNQDNWESDAGTSVGQHSVATPNLLAIYSGTCDVYLGAADQAITVLTPRLSTIGGGSRRTQSITTAKLAQAYAHAGAPDIACTMILAILDANATVGSQTTRSELRRTLPLLARWPARDDVAEVRHRLTAVG
jgi:hypothetical protein